MEQTSPGAAIVDLTSHGVQPWRRFRPFSPQGTLPVPVSPGRVSASGEGIWQGRTVVEHAAVDPSPVTVTSLKGLKRSGRASGRVLGHRQGVEGVMLLDDAEARRVMSRPTSEWVLGNRLHDDVMHLTGHAETQTVSLWDDETNGDVADRSHPRSHAGWVNQYLEGPWPRDESTGQERHGLS
jgi:hypothetical protein